MKRQLAALQKELQDAKDEMDDSVGKQGDLNLKLHKCRELIAVSLRRIAEDHLAEHQIITQTGSDSTTIGLMFDERGGKITIDYVMVGGPAFKSKKVDKGDVILSIDDKQVKGAAIITALQGKPSSSVTLKIQKKSTGRVEDVMLERMLTAAIADKRQMFDIFTQIESLFTQKNDAIGVKYTEDALELWTQMMLEEQDQDDK